jgi:WXG100 family type VII secretion target
MAIGSFDSAEIANHAQLTRQRAADLEESIANLRSAAAQLSSVWTGPGAAAFQTAREEWERAVQPLQQSLLNMGQALGQAGQAYEQNEASIQQVFGR